MSSVNLQRIKEIRKKESSGFETGIPIGTDGLLVDMISGLDLEEELKLGNNHSATITEDNNTTRIVEQYYDNNSPTKNLKYSVSIEIVEDQTNNETTISMILYKGEINSNNILHRKTTIIDESSLTVTQINQEVDGE